MKGLILLLSLAFMACCGASIPVNSSAPQPQPDAVATMHCVSGTMSNGADVTFCASVSEVCLFVRSKARDSADVLGLATISDCDEAVMTMELKKE